MKNLKAYTVADPATNLDSFKQVAGKFDGLEVQYETDIEQAINTFSLQSFDLLIIDKGLSHEDYNKLHKVADLLHPDAALVAFIMTDEEFIHYKLAGLLAKWTEAHSESKTNFIDNPKL
ncbi:hypothetical protein U0035_11455 [Niabella yanshanensis]|uniref:Response regulatory domain-containing protein n=1 Tax=Niabella yanshanensis TaxID=577386 RepID=A0ABZ0WDJ2_9BACT|nr:hypothetical protein [Niabella yanshanensis]WQD40766.1 hypothetical protein U0035_11455 [Niabella yanshanensis]